MNEIYSIVLLTLKICFISTSVSAILALFLGFRLGINDSKTSNIFKTITSAFTSLPPVIAGLWCTCFFKNGIFGKLSWLYTEKVIILAQVLIVIPIICANIYPAVESIRNSYLETCLGLGISKFTMYRQLLKEVKYPIISAIITGFGRAISEVGAVMIVGGNIRFKTRVLTSAIVLENNKGNYQMSIKLGIILMVISLSISMLAMVFRGRESDKIRKYRSWGFRKKTLYYRRIHFPWRQKYILTGENGTGKSTLLKSFVGLNDFVKGKIVSDKDIVYQAQNSYIFKKTPRDNFKIIGVDAEEIRDQLEYLEIEKLIDQDIDSLSGGERKK